MDVHRFGDIAVGFAVLTFSMYVWTQGRSPWQPGEPGEPPSGVATIQIIDDMAAICGFMRHQPQPDSDARRHEERIVWSALRAKLRELGIKRYGIQRPHDAQIRWRAL
ncbi:MAG: hypothetical protein GC162_10400 [Planctomycetes bacterium]|nr:hypothetical protein [Planctomycetota bacterium]